MSQKQPPPVVVGSAAKHHHHQEEADQHLDVTGSSSTGGGSPFTTQVYATLRRLVIQKRRMPCSMCLEVMLPVFFILGLVLAAQASTITNNPAQQFLSDGNSSVPSSTAPPVDFSETIVQNMCYNRTTLQSITPGFGGENELRDLGMRACDDIPAADLNLPAYIPGVQRSCSRAEDLNAGSGGIPIAGLCVLGGRPTSFMIESTLTSYKQSIRLLDFDRFVLLQWMVKITKFETLAGGIFSNTVLGNAGRLLFTPSSQATTTHLINYLNATYPLFKHVNGGTFSSRAAAFADATTITNEGTTWAVVDVPQIDSSLFNVFISMNRSASPPTSKSFIRSRFAGGLGTAYRQYYHSGFLTLQATLNRYYLRKVVVPSYVGGSNLAYVSDPSTITPAPTMSNAELEYLLDLQEAAAVNLEDDLTMAPMGFGEYKDSEFLSIAGSISPLVMVLSFLYTVSQLAKRLVEEKEFRLREGTMIMGLGKAAFFTSWYIIYIAQILVTALLVAIVLKAGLTTGSDFFLLFFLYLLFGISAVAMSGCLSSCFNKSRITALVVPLLYFMLSIPSFALGTDTSPTVFAILSFFSPVAFSVGTGLVFNYEINNGMGWADVASSLDTPLNMITVFTFLVIDIFIYLGLMIYFDMVLPKEWGTRSHPCFCFLWCCSKSSDENDSKNEAAQEKEYDEKVDTFTAAVGGEHVSNNRPILWHQLKSMSKFLKSHKTPSQGGPGAQEVDAARREENKEMRRVLARVEEYPLDKNLSSVHVKRVRKEFEIDGPAASANNNNSDSDIDDDEAGNYSSASHPTTAKKNKSKSKKNMKVAVDDVDLRFFPDMVTVLLGHNGAGKTTTMNMITGMMDTSKGDVIIYDKSVNKELTAARSEIGFCPQHNILWDQLSCIEHLEYFARLKGVPSAEVTSASIEMLIKVDLLDKKDVYSANLSGGQKRKLSVAIAFLGGSRLVLLDEPTAGMDVAARRHTWELIKDMTKEGTGRTVLLTTHFMDEADLLGNRIAIMSKGALHSYGSSMFLKQKLGAGYTMKINSNRNLFPDTDGPAILHVLQSRFDIPGSSIKECKGQELSIALPRENTAQFPDLIKYVETDPTLQQQYGIQGISMSVATLEDVFLAIAHEEEMKAAELKNGKKIETSTTNPSRHTAAVDIEMKEGEHNVPADVMLLSECYERLSMHNDASSPATAAGMSPPAFKANFVRQLMGLLVKRIHYMKRDKRTIFLQVFMPLICILLAMGLSEFGPPGVQEIEIGGPAMYDYADSDAIQDFALSNCTQSISSFINSVSGNPLENYEQINNYMDNDGEGNTSFGFSTYLMKTAKSHGNTERMRAIACRDPRQSRINTATTVSSPRFPYDASTATPTPSFNISQGAKLTTTLITNTSAAYSAPEVLNQYFQTLSRYVRYLILVNSSSPATAAKFNDPATVSTFNEFSPSVDTASFASEFEKATAVSMRLYSESLPYTDREKVSIEAISKLLTALFILIPFTFIPSTYVAFVVKERECKAKHLQFVSGVNYIAYWLANFIFDLASFQLTALLAMAIFGVFSREEYIGSSEAGGATFTVILLYGISGIAWAYGVSFLFDNHSNAQNIVMLVNFMCGFILVLAVFILGNLESTKDAATVVVFFFRLIPSFCLGEGFLNLALESAARDIRASSGLGAERSLFHWDVIGFDLLFMGIESVVFSVMVLLWESPSRKSIVSILPCFKSEDNTNKRTTTIHSLMKKEEDDDENEHVSEERALVEKYFKHHDSSSSHPTSAGGGPLVPSEGNNSGAQSRADDVVRVMNLRKVFDVPASKKDDGNNSTITKEKVAVKNLTLGVKKGEIFGFLGTNGAGKSTTMSILTGEYPPTAGKATVGGYDILTQSSEAQQVTGYCPQFDAILDLLTPTEHLYLYASLRGIPMSETDNMVAALMKACGLEEFAAVPSGEMSGGNKRKLSVALALIGTPKIVFLDEPSAGMDPHARRQMWDVILFIATHCSVILTTHHLEEVDVLAHRAGIMVDGALKCLGSLESLKREFGGGFELWIKVGEVLAVDDGRGKKNGNKIGDDDQASTSNVLLSSAEAERRILELIAENFPGFKIVEQRQGRFTFSIPFESTSLSNVFDVIQRATAKSLSPDADETTNYYGISDYTVQQASLEQVFMRISNNSHHHAHEGDSDDDDASKPALIVPNTPQLSRTNRRSSL